MKIYRRTDFPTFDWKQLDGKRGTIKIGRDGLNELVVFQEDEGSLFVLAWIEKKAQDSQAHSSWE